MKQFLPLPAVGPMALLVLAALGAACDKAAPEPITNDKAGAASTQVGSTGSAPGTGKAHPGPSDQVKVNYTGWTAADGKMFDSSVTRGEPAGFRADGVIKGWTEGLQLMTTGEKARFWIPGKLAYGDKAAPGMPSGMLVFDVELLDVTGAPKPPAVPADVKAVPANATKTSSGLAYRVLEKGKGPAKHPGPTDRVTVNYSGWTTDGKMFDSSVTRGQPASFGLNGVIKGWTEGVQLMSPGDKFRFWIPGDLAYGDNPRPGAPAGTLVFDIDLISID
jgi:FKBP-type peptidyl-prolyl cis-trans isomerase